MDCRTCRLDLSARLDGEELATSDVEVDAHLGACAACRRFANVSAGLDEAVPALAAEVPPSRSADLLAAMAAARQTVGRRRQAIRLGLLGVAVVQLVLAAPMLLLGAEGHSGHLARHLGAWDVALAVGFLVAAAQPVRALGLLPMAAALAGSMLVAAGLDAVGGRIVPFNEVVHLLELAGLVLLWALSRSTPRPAGTERVWVAS